MKGAWSTNTAMNVTSALNATFTSVDHHFIRRPIRDLPPRPPSMGKRPQTQHQTVRNKLKSTDSLALPERPQTQHQTVRNKLKSTDSLVLPDRPQTQHQIVRNKLKSTDSIVLPEKQLLNRYRHVYAGRGGMYRPNSTAGLPTHSDSPLNAYLDSYKKELLLKLTKSVYQRKVSGEVRRSMEASHVEEDGEALSRAPARASSQAPAQSSNQDIQSTSLSSEHSQATRSRTSDKNCTLLNGDKRQSNRPRTAIACQSDTYKFSGGKTNKDANLSPIKSGSEFNYAIKNGDTGNKRFHAEIGGRLRSYKNVESQQLGHIASPLINRRLHNNLRPVTAFSRLSSDKGTSHNGNKIIVSSSNSGEPASCLSYCQPRQSIELDTDEVKFNGSNPDRSAISQSQQKSHEYWDSQAQREQKIGPGAASSIKAQDLNSNTHNRTKLQEDSTNTNEVDSGAIENSENDTENSKRAVHSGHHSRLLTDLHMRVMRERSFFKEGTTREKRGKIEDSMLRTTKKIRVKPMSEEALKAIEETKQEMNRKQKTMSTDEGAVSGVTNRSSCSSQDAVKDIPGRDGEQVSNDEGIASSICSNLSEDGSPEERLAHPPPVRNNALGYSPRMTFTHGINGVAHKPPVVHPLMNNKQLWEKPPRQKGNSATALKRQLQRMRESCEALGGTQTSPRTAQAQTSPRKFAHIRTPYVKHGLPRIDNETVTQDGQTKRGVKSDNPPNVDVLKRMYPNVHKYSTHLSSLQSESMPAFQFAAAKQKFNETEYTLKSRLPRDMENKEPYSPRVSLEDLRRWNGSVETSGSKNGLQSTSRSTMSNATPYSQTGRLVNMPADTPRGPLPPMPEPEYREGAILGMHNKASREKSFQITPMGYDIRYVELRAKNTNVDEEEEVYPETVRVLAVEKCNQWLQKYT